MQGLWVHPGLSNKCSRQCQGKRLGIRSAGRELRCWCRGTRPSHIAFLGDESRKHYGQGHEEAVSQ